MWNPSQSCGTSPAIWDHTVLPATRHKWTRPALTQPVNWYSIYLPREMEGWDDLGYTRQCTGRVSNSRPLDCESNAVTITLPSQMLNIATEFHENWTSTFREITITKGDVQCIRTNPTNQQTRVITIIPGGGSNELANCLLDNNARIVHVAQIYVSTNDWYESTTIFLHQHKTK